MTIQTALREINNAVLDLQSADYNTYERPLKRLALALKADHLKLITDELRSKADFDEFLKSANEGGSFMGSARLNWPSGREEELGLTIQLIERASENPMWFLNLAHKYYYSGQRKIGGIRKITSSVIIPFNRDFVSYVEGHVPSLLVEKGGKSIVTEAASGVTYNIWAMHNSPLQHISSGGYGVQTASYSSDDLQNIVKLYKRHIDELGLDTAQRRRADSQIATIEAQLIDEPDPTIVKAAGKSLKTIIEGAIGGAAGTALASAQMWTPLLTIFG